MVAASTVVSAKDRLPSCILTPKFLCCTERHIDHFSFEANKCPHKMQNYDEIITAIIGSYENIEPKFYNPQTTSISTAIPIPITLSMAITQNVRRQSFKASILFVERNSPSKKLFELLKSCYVISRISRHQASIYRTYDDYGYVNQQHPITGVSDCNLSSHCSTENSRPLYSAYLPQKLFDKPFFLACCQQHVPTNYHSLCTYKHRERISVETLMQAIQRNAYDLKYPSNILHCASQYQGNRNCRQFLEMTSPELKVPERCLHMCNIAPQSGDRIGTFEKNDLVCFSNWNVLMAHAFAYVRSIKKKNNRNKKKHIPYCSKLFLKSIH